MSIEIDSWLVFHLFSWLNGFFGKSTRSQHFIGTINLVFFVSNNIYAGIRFELRHHLHLCWVSIKYSRCSISPPSSNIVLCVLGVCSKNVIFWESPNVHRDFWETWRQRICNWTFWFHRGFEHFCKGFILALFGKFTISIGLDVSYSYSIR